MRRHPSYMAHSAQQQQQHPRRGPGPMLGNTAQTPQQMSAQQIQAQHHAAMMERETAKRRARKPTDKNIPDGVEEVVPMAETYKSLRDMERRYDAAIMRKRLDIQDAVNRNVKNEKTVRIFISNTAKDQPWQVSNQPLDEHTFDFDTGTIPTFRVRIEGRLLDDPDGDAADANPDSDLGLPVRDLLSSHITPVKKKFSHFFKSIAVELDRPKELHPDGNSIEWRKQPPNTQPATTALGLTGPSEFDGFEFERKGDETIECTIKLVRDEAPDRFRLSPALAHLLDTTVDTRAGIVMKIWEYVRLHGLQDENERRSIVCDAALTEIFGAERLFFPTIPELTLSQILPLEPIVVPFTIRCDVPAHASPTVFDVKVLVDDPIRQKMAVIINSPAYNNALRDILEMDDQLAVLVQGIHHSKAKRDFWNAMADDPAAFINRWVSSQKRDLDTLMGEAAARTVEEEDAKRALFREKMNESVYMLLAKQSARTQ